MNTRLLYLCVCVCVCVCVRVCVHDADKGIPLCFRGAMETLRDLRQAYQDVGKGSRWAYGQTDRHTHSHACKHTVHTHSLYFRTTVKETFNTANQGILLTGAETQTPPSVHTNTHLSTNKTIHTSIPAPFNTFLPLLHQNRE